MTANPLIKPRNGGIRTHDPLTPRLVGKPKSIANTMWLWYSLFTDPHPHDPKESKTSVYLCKPKGA